jgi:DNA primase
MVQENTTALAMQRSDYRFSRKDVRSYTGWTDFQVKTHIKKLEALEYLLVHRGCRGQSFVYELLYDGQGHDGQAFLMGLIDSKQLQHAYDKKKVHGKTKLAGPSSPQVAPKAPGSCSTKNDVMPINKGAGDDDADALQKCSVPVTHTQPSYRSHRPTLLSKGT